jgi:3-oxoacyl-[acyl-carrier-protein] synthase-3
MSVPDRVLTNQELEKWVDTSDEWITSRTGIRERRISAPEETSFTLGVSAARDALAMAGIPALELDMVICATTTGDFLWPATACLIQQALGAAKASAFDVSAAYSGFVYALSIADGFIKSGAAKYILVVGADTLTKQLNWNDRNTCVLFGDGAGAVVVGPCEHDTGLLSFALGADGSRFDAIGIKAGGTRYPLTCELLADQANTITMRGSEVFKFAVKIIGDATLLALEKAGLSSSDIQLFIPHQANLRIIKAAADRMKLNAGQVFLNVQRYGNTSAASIPIAMAEAVKENRLSRGDVVVTVGFGAGLTWGANVIRWILE